MTKLLSKDQIANYRKDGFVTGIEVMTRDQAQAYLRALEAAEALQGQRLIKGSNFKPHRLFRWADELAYHPRILDAVEDLIGPDIRTLSSTVFAKMPGNGSYVYAH